MFNGLVRDIMFNDDENLVRIRAVEFLGLNNQPLDEKIVMDIIKNSKSETEANLILNTVALLKTVNQKFKIHVPKEIFHPEWIDKEQDLVSRRIEFINESK
jgi:hypothetical protein